jgi:hypothetical protein
MTKSVQKAVAAHTARLKASGGSRITLKLSPQATVTLNRLAATHGSRTKVIELLLSKKS